MKKLLTGIIPWLGLLIFLAQPRAGSAQSTLSVAGALDTQKPAILAAVAARLQTNTLATSYTTVWRQFEDGVIKALTEVLPGLVGGLSRTNFDHGQTGREKNRTADLAVRCSDGDVEVSIKSARAGANPENDLGTFRDHPNRKRQFAASFTLWVRYVDQGGEVRCDRVFFDRSWRFVGKSSLVDGVKYRKKDGNMRPKPWVMFESGEAFWQTEAEFEAAVKRAEVFRANELIKEYLDDLSESDQRLLYERLKRQFETPASAKR